MAANQKARLRKPMGRARPAARRAEPEAAAQPAQPPQRASSAVRQLVVEVDRLQAELATARQQVAELEARADVDPLLDIFNRRGFERELKRALAYVRRYGTEAALIYLDLDGFKPVNDTHGHAAGDAVLRAVAAALTHGVRASDTVARLGGDEFVMLLWNLSEAHATAKAAALEQVVGATQVAWNGTTLSVGASAGYAMMSSRDDASDVLARADQAMYVRKAERKRAR